MGYPWECPAGYWFEHCCMANLDFVSVNVTRMYVHALFMCLLLETTTAWLKRSRDPHAQKYLLFTCSEEAPLWPSAKPQSFHTVSGETTCRLVGQ